MLMEISYIYKNLRYFSNPNFLFSNLYASQSIRFSLFSDKTLISIISATSSCCSTQNPKFYFTSGFDSSAISRNPRLPSTSISSISSSSRRSQGTKCGFFTSKIASSCSVYTVDRLYLRSFSDSSGKMRSKRNGTSKRSLSHERVTEIVEMIEKEKEDMEEELNRVFSSVFSLAEVNEIFRVLSLNRVSGLRFFQWICEMQTDFNRSSEFCSLVIDNLGRVEDYKSMLLLFKDFSKKKICLTEKAFAFLSVCVWDRVLVREVVKKIVDMLNSVGGSCRNSGIHGLIKMLCSSNLFDSAMYVMELTERKTSYYNILIWARCRSGDFEKVRDLFDVMRRVGCELNANSYNYLLSSLCKNERMVEASNLLEEMEGLGFLPDAITFEVIIYHVCQLGRLDFAVEFLKCMMSKGIEPRLTTHAAFIKGYFHCDRLQEAYKYVVDMGDKYKCSENLNYSLLASLLQRSRRVVEAQEILVDMIAKGLRPNFSVYMKVTKDLHRLGMKDLVIDLKSRFMKLDGSN